jgi:hypothetical protein
MRSEPGRHWCGALGDSGVDLIDGLQRAAFLGCVDAFGSWITALAAPHIAKLRESCALDMDLSI